MTGTLQIKKLKSGNSYYYVKLSYKDSRTNEWKQKTLATKLETKNNKRKAEAMIPKFIEQYSYLEDLPSGYNYTLNPDITLCDYMDLWLKDKEIDLKEATFESYTYRVNRIKEYFRDCSPRLIKVFYMLSSTRF